MSNADIFIIYDNTQYKTDDWQNRNKIRTKEGSIWLTIPVRYSFGDNINVVKIANPAILKKHWRSILANYSKAPFFEKYKKQFEEIYSKNWENLCELNVELIRMCAKILGIKTKIILASELMDLKTKGPQALLDMLKEIGASKYISGVDGKKYLDLKEFEKENIDVVFQDYKYPEYNQVYKGFEPYMCIIDLIFNEGPKSLKILRNE